MKNKPAKTEAGKPKKRSKIIMTLKLIWFGIRITAAFTMIFVGFAGVVLPVLPGWVLLIPGFALLYREIMMILRGIRNWFFRKFPLLEKLAVVVFPPRVKEPPAKKPIDSQSPPALENPSPSNPTRPSP